MRLTLTRIVLIGGLFLFPSLASAATTIPHLRAAITFAQTQGWCTTKDPTKADCKQVAVLCNNKEWQDWVSDHLEYSGSQVTVQKGEEDEVDPVVLQFLRDDDRNPKGLPEYVTASCFCECAANDTREPCKGKEAGTPFLRADGMVREECEAACQPGKMAPKCAGTLLPVIPTDTPAAARAAGAASASINALCFSPSECSEQGGIFEAYNACGGGKGRCIALEPEITLNTPIGGVTKVQGFANYIVTAYRYAVSIAAIVATIVFIYGAFLYLVTASMPNVRKGKNIMIDAVVGMLLVIGAATILRTINPATLKLNPIKVFMINTVQFINAQFCSDLEGGIKLAHAGKKPALLTYDDVAKNPQAFSVSKDAAKCGESYWLENVATGSACEGSFCEKQGEACLSCADGVAPGCRGLKAEERVCDTVRFAGTVEFADKRYPDQMYLISYCNHGQTTDEDIVEDNVSLLKDTDPERVGRSVGGGTTDEDVIGRAVYRFGFNEIDISQAANYCTSYGGLRGFLVAVQYDDEDVTLGVGTGGIDDFAIVTKRNCGSRSPFSGYADGSTVEQGDFGDVESAVQCGNVMGKLLDSPGTFWTQQEMNNAASGKSPIICNLNLSNANAPGDPKNKYCGGAGVGGQLCINGNDCAAPGTLCSSVPRCVCNADKVIECQ